MQDRPRDCKYPGGGRGRAEGERSGGAFVTHRIKGVFNIKSKRAIFHGWPGLALASFRRMCPLWHYYIRPLE